MHALKLASALLAAAYFAGAAATLAGGGDRQLIGSLLFVPLAAAGLSLSERRTARLIRSLVPAFLIFSGMSIALLFLALIIMDAADSVSRILTIPMEAVGYLMPSSHDILTPALGWILSMAALVLAAACLLAAVRAWRRGRDGDRIGPH